MPKFIGPPRIPHGGRALDDFCEDNEALIRKELKLKSGRAGFSTRRIHVSCLSRAKILKKAEKLPAKKLQKSLSGLDNGRKSAACPREAVRLRMMLLSGAYASLHTVESYHVIVVDPGWSQPMGQLSPDWVKPVIRKIRSGAAKLRQAGYLVQGVAVVELCVDRSLDGKLSWSPHFHMVITGAPKSEIAAAFAVRLPAGRRGKDKPVRVVLIKPGEVGHVLSYISKMKPELRSAYMHEGRKRRRRNHLPKELLPDWLSAMADRPITEMVVHFGQGPDIARRFRTAEMSFILGELL